jgi:PAS domain S-box-containing protein
MSFQKAFEMKYSADELRGFIDSSPTLTWSCSPDGSVDFFNQRWLDYTGLSDEQARGWGWTVALHPDDLNGLVDYWRSVLASREPGEIEGRLRRFDGVYRWFLFRATPSFDNDGTVVKWFGTNTDIEDRKRAECLLAGENHVLEMTAKGSSLESILEALCRVVEQTTSGCFCSVLLFDPSSSKIQQAVAPSLPSSYNDRFPGIPVDREGGPCTEAARRKTQVIVSDVASDTRLDRYDWRTAALTHGLKACWSTTISASTGLVLGTFAIYWREPRTPTEQDQKIIEQMTHLAAVAIERHRNEAALQQSEERFRLIVDSIPGFVCTLNAAGEVEHLNRQVLEYFGKTTEELKNWAMSDAVHPDDLPRVIEGWSRSVETGQPYVLEFRQRRADGVYRWFQSRALPARDAEGRITCWYMLLTDIDDRKRTEDALRSNEQSLRLTVDSIPGFVSTMSAAGEAEFVSRQVLEYFGKSFEELKNWGANDTLHPDDRPRMIDAWSRAIETGQPFDFESRRRRADGVYRWFHLRSRPQRDAEGRIVRWYNLTTDIDDRKKAEEALRRSKAYLTEAQRLSQTGSFGCRPSTGEMSWSEETFRIYGYDRSTQPAVERVLERVHPEDRALVQQRMDRAFHDGQGCQVECRLLLPDDSVKHVRIVAHASKNESGVIEFIGAIMDVTPAKEAEERIRQDERELRTTIETIPAFVSSTLPDGSVDFVSRGWLDYVGRSREEMVGDAWKSTIHPEDLDRVLNNWQGALATGEPLEMETRYRRADGEYRWFLVRSVPLRDDKGNIVKWYATVFDIEDRKQTEEKLRRSEALLAGENLILEMIARGEALSPMLDALCRLAEEVDRGALASLLLFDIESSRLWNGAAPSLPHSYTQAIDGSVVGPDVGPCTMAASISKPVIVSDIKSETQWPEFRDLAAAHELRACWSTPILSSKRKVLGTFALYRKAPGAPTPEQENVISQMTHLASVAIERSRAIEELQTKQSLLSESEQRFRAIFDEAGAGISWVDLQPDMPIRNNRALQRMLGCTQEELSRFETYDELTCAEDREADASTFRELCDGKRDTLRLEKHFNLRDGRSVWANVIFTLLRDFAGQPRFIVVIHEDITERKIAEDALQKAQAELAHVTRVATLGEMTASISHEINQPLGAVVNNASACLRWLAAQNLEEARRSAALVIADGHRAGEIVARIRALAKKAPARKDWFDVNETIREVIALARSEVQGNRVSLKTQLADDLPPILGDRIQFQQVLLNLIMNAIEAMRGIDGGPRELWVGSERVESMDVLITVRDSGAGMDAQSLDRLFEAFYTTKPEGLGMGLAISRSIIEAHGGRLWATANAPHGAVFQFTLPTDGKRLS